METTEDNESNSCSHISLNILCNVHPSVWQLMC